MGERAPLQKSRRQRVLHVEDDDLYLTAASRALRSVGYDVARATTRAEALAAIETERFDAFLVELSLAQDQDGGLRFIEVVRKRLVMTHAVVLTGHLTYQAALRLRALNVEYLPKLGLEFDSLAQYLVVPTTTKATSGMFARVDGPPSGVHLRDPRLEEGDDPELEAARILLRSKRPLRDRMARTESKLVSEAVAMNHGNRTAAARALITSRQRVQVVLREADDDDDRRDDD